jgi:hypothetical protein
MGINPPTGAMQTTRRTTYHDDSLDERACDDQPIADDKPTNEMVRRLIPQPL